MNQYQSYIHLSRYSRFLNEEKRRETWEETVDRYLNFFKDRIPEKDREKTIKKLKEYIINLEAMPSMRALMSSGAALEKDHVAGYNCSYIAVDDPRAFPEAMYISMCGTGVGFSVERQYINKLPEVAEEFHPTETKIKVKDSKIGWATAFNELLSLLWVGKIPSWDVSSVRPSGTPLKTFGGRASGPEPLERLFKFVVALFQKSAGRRLTSIECHDIMCVIADVVVSGGVRRSAMLSLSNLTDERLRNAKTGQWWESNGQRALANNSVAYTEKPDIGIFMKEWQTLFDSKSGERGIFNRVAAIKQAKKNERRKTEGFEPGTNPCGEIILRSMQFCNLSEVVVRPEDTRETLLKKVEAATILGTLQSSLTDFRYLRKAWKKNCEEERLLGVSLTGIMDNPITAGIQGLDLKGFLTELKEKAIAVNKLWADKLGINQSVAITCVKPSGTVSALVNSSSGIHPRYAKYYIRRVRNDAKDPLCKTMIDAGFPFEIDETNSNVAIFSFPMKSPDDAITRNDRTAIEQLEHYLIYKNYWCEHNPSVTIYIKSQEWLDVAAWVYKHFDDLGGVSFLPADEGTTIYKQPPYEEIDEKKYLELLDKMPKNVDLDKLDLKEDHDTSNASRELACSAGACEL